MKTSAFLLPYERFDDLQCREGGGYYLIQSAKKFRFTSDSVRLANFAAVRIKGKKRVVELGSGTGVITALLCAKTNATAVCVEIDSALCDMFNRSLICNDLTDRVKIINGDLRTVTARDTGACDVVIVNPPYYKCGSGARRNADAETTACEELTATLTDIAGAGSRLLTDGGSFYVCYTVTRLAEVMTALSAVRLEPKELCIVGKVFYLRCVKSANVGLVIVDEPTNKTAVK